MKVGNTLRIFIFASVGLLAMPAQAQDAIVFGPVRGMGGAGSANPTDNSAITLNPATTALMSRYEIQGHFSITKGPDTSFAASITDSKTAPVTLGLVYQRIRFTGGEDAREWPGWVDTNTEFARRKRYDVVTLAAAYPVLDRKLSFGLNGTLAKYNHDIQGKGLTGNLDVGIAAQPIDGWGIGVSGRNLLPISGCKITGSQTRPCIPDYDMGVLIGTYLGDPNLGAFSLDVDIHISGPEGGPPVSVRTGFQKTIAQFAVETGYRWEGPTKEHWLTAGFGMIQNNTGLQYAIEVPLHPKPWDPLAMTHMLSVRVMGAGGALAERPPSR